MAPVFILEAIEVSLDEIAPVTTHVLTRTSRQLWTFGSFPTRHLPWPPHFNNVTHTRQLHHKIPALSQMVDATNGLELGKTGPGPRYVYFIAVLLGVFLSAISACKLDK